MIPYIVTMLNRVPKAFAFQPIAFGPSSLNKVSATTCTSSRSTASNIGTRLFSSSSSSSSSTEIEIKNLDIKGPEIPPIPPMSKRLFLVRHGEVINPGGDRPVYYGSLDVSLSPLGEQEAKVASEYLKQFELQHVAASPLSRAKFGANQVLSRQQQQQQKETNYEIKIFNGFTELDRGAWCGKTKDEIGIDLMTRFDSCDEDATPEGGESYPQLKTRVLEARDELLDGMDCGMASVVVSHLQVTRSMLSDALDIPTHEMCNFKIATASVACVDFCVSSGQQTVHFQNFKPDVGLATSKDGAN